MHSLPDPSNGVVARYAAAWAAGDLAALIDLYADDVVAHYGGTSAFAGTHVGRQRFLEVLLETSGRAARRLERIDAVHDDGPTGAIFATESFTVDGESVSVARALRYRIADGRIAEVWLYDHDQHVVDRAWS